MSRKAMAEHSLLSLPRISGLPRDHLVNVMIRDEYVRRRVDRNVVAGSLNLIEAEVWRTMRVLDEVLGSSRDTTERLAQEAQRALKRFDVLRQLSERDPVWVARVVAVALEEFKGDLHRVREGALQKVARIAREIEEWIAKVGTLAQIPGADGRLSSRGGEVAEAFRHRFGAVRGDEFDGAAADLDQVIGFAFKEFGGVQLGEYHADAWVRR